jgi:RNA polymerase sigma factor (sigma-70 family)
LDRPGSQNSSEHVLLHAARAGDEEAFRRLVDTYRSQLHAHCYRMLGSVHDADDALQEALLAAWRGLAGFEGRSPLRSWLYTIATNASLRLIGQRPKRVLPADRRPAGDPRGELGEPLLESVWIEPYPDEQLGYEQRESVELAFVAALQRARRTLDERVPQRSQQAAMRSLGDERSRALVAAFVDAWDRADVGAILTMLAEDATFTMPPLPTWFRGRDDIGVFVGDRVFATPWRFVALRASGQPAMAGYQRDPHDGVYRLSALNVLTLRDAEVVGLTSFLDPDVHRRFELPPTVAPGSTR